METRRLKLLIIASLFEPQKNSGGPPISLKNLILSIKDKFEIFVISKNHEVNSSAKLDGIESGWNYFEYGQVYYFEYKKNKVSNVIKLIETISPDVIYQNSIFSFDDMLPLMLYERRHPNIKVIVAPRGELCFNRLKKGKVKKYIYLELLSLFGINNRFFFHGTGADEVNDILRNIKTRRNQVYCMQNLTSIKSEFTIIKKEIGEARIVFIARIHPQKNLENAIRYLDNIKGKLVLDIYGSIEDMAYWKKCLDVIKKLPETIQVNYAGFIEHTQVPEKLAKYHALYLPTIGENFGHSIVEALKCARPVIISDKTQWSDLDGIAGFVVPLNDGKGFTESIQNIVEMNQDEFNQLSERAVEYIETKLNVDEIVQEYLFAFQSKKRDRYDLENESST